MSNDERDQQCQAYGQERKGASEGFNVAGLVLESVPEAAGSYRTDEGESQRLWQPGLCNHIPLTQSSPEPHRGLPNANRDVEKLESVDHRGTPTYGERIKYPK